MPDHSQARPCRRNRSTRVYDRSLGRNDFDLPQRTSPTSSSSSSSLSLHTSHPVQAVRILSHPYDGTVTPSVVTTQLVPLSLQENHHHRESTTCANESNRSISQQTNAVVGTAAATNDAVSSSLTTTTATTNHILSSSIVASFDEASTNVAKLGVQFYWRPGSGAPVQIKRLLDGSPLCGTSVQPGHSVLTINGVGVRSATHAAQLVHAAALGGGAGATITLETTSGEDWGSHNGTGIRRSGSWLHSDPAPWCRLVAAVHDPTTTRVSSMTTIPAAPPTLVWTSTRGGCLVRVSRVWKGPWSKRVWPGDLVLAVNGTAVATPDQADRVLVGVSSSSFSSSSSSSSSLDHRRGREGRCPPPQRQPQRQQRRPTCYTCLYVVDMHAYRQSMLEELRALPHFHAVSMELALSSASARSNVDREHWVVTVRSRGLRRRRRQVSFDVRVDPETLHVRCTTVMGTASKDKVYRTKVVPFLQALNEGVDRRMHLLEQAVSGQVWKQQHVVAAATQDANCGGTTTLLQDAPSMISISSRKATTKRKKRAVSADGSGHFPPTVSANCGECEDDVSVSSDDNTHGNHNDDDDRNDADGSYADDETFSSEETPTIPLAFAEMEVLPIEALQSEIERNANAPTLAAL